jgi:hypothetical protein
VRSCGLVEVVAEVVVAEELKLKRIIYSAVFLLPLFVLVACGGEDTNKAVPTASDPSATPVPAQPAAAPAATGCDSRIPADICTRIRNGEAVNLKNSSGTVIYKGLEDLAGVFAPPLVGDPHLDVKLTINSAGGLDGSLIFSFEDKQGLWYMQQGSFDGTGFKNDSVIDIIFQDDVVVTRISAIRSGDGGDTLDAYFYYRIREAGDHECMKVTVDYGPTPDTITPCEQYMNTANAEVKLLGRISGSLSTWITR